MGLLLLLGGCVRVPYHGMSQQQKMHIATAWSCGLWPINCYAIALNYFYISCWGSLSEALTVFHNFFRFYMSDASYSLASSLAHVLLGILWEMLMWTAEKWTLYWCLLFSEGVLIGHCSGPWWGLGAQLLFNRESVQNLLRMPAQPPRLLYRHCTARTYKPSWVVSRLGSFQKLTVEFKGPAFGSSGIIK